MDSSLSSGTVTHVTEHFTPPPPPPPTTTRNQEKVVEDLSDDRNVAQEPPILLGSISGMTAVQHQPSEPAGNARCQCGCVPNILSLFEMAKLRDAARKKRREQEAVEKGETAVSESASSRYK
jgi:hypothetical protein